MVGVPSPGLLALNTPDTIELLWLTDDDKAAAVAAALQANAAALGIKTIYAGREIERVFGGRLDYARNRRPTSSSSRMPA